MGEQRKQNDQMSEQHGRKPGQNPPDVDRDRGSYEPGSEKPGRETRNPDRDIPVREGEDMNPRQRQDRKA